MNAWIALAIALSTVSLWTLALLAGRAERKIDQAIGEIIRMRIELERAAGGGTDVRIQERELELADILAPPKESRKLGPKPKPVELTDEHEWRLAVEGKVPADR